MAEENGTWLDTQSGKVVNKQPVEGVQLHAPDTELTPDIRAAIDAAKEASEPGKTQVEKAVTSKSVSKATTS